MFAVTSSLKTNIQFHRFNLVILLNGDDQSILEVSDSTDLDQLFPMEDSLTASCPNPDPASPIDLDELPFGNLGTSPGKLSPSNTIMPQGWQAVAGYEASGIYERATPEELQEATESALRIMSVRLEPGHDGVTGYLGFRPDNDGPKISENLMDGNNPDVDHETIFDDFLTPIVYREVLRPASDRDDPTLPRTIEDCKAHVKMLFKTFKSTALAQDSEQMLKPFKEHRHDNRLVECLCWSLLNACRARSEQEGPLLNAYEPSKARNNMELSTFSKRFDAIVRALAQSKTICKHLFDAPYINTFVDDPIRAITRVHANKELNKQKADVMRKGKEVLEQEEKQQKSPMTPKRKRTKLTTKLSNSEEATEDDGGPIMTESPTTPSQSRRHRPRNAENVSFTHQGMIRFDQNNEASPTPSSRLNSLHICSPPFVKQESRDVVDPMVEQFPRLPRITLSYNATPSRALATTMGFTRGGTMPMNAFNHPRPVSDPFFNTPLPAFPPDSSDLHSHNNFLLETSHLPPQQQEIQDIGEMSNSFHPQQRFF